MFSENPQYKEVFHSTVHNLRFYMPQDVANGYHMSRYVAAGAQNIYAAGGATKELLSNMMDKMLEICNDEKSLKTLRSDIATLANNIKYRLRYPVDEDCALRMGAIYTFVEGENPDITEDFWTNKKVALAKGDATQGIVPDPSLYAFFLSIGIPYTPAWSGQLDILTDTNYFNQKKRAAQRPDATIRSVDAQVDEWYDGFWDIAMKYCEGDLQAAEHMMDTSVFMFYYRIKQKAHYTKWHNEQMQDAKKSA